jgi:hypothetical protein
MWLLDLLIWGSIAFLFYIATGSGRIALIETIIFRVGIGIVITILILFFTGHFVRAILLTIAVVAGYQVYRHTEDRRLKNMDEEANAGNKWMKNLWDTRINQYEVQLCHSGCGLDSLRLLRPSDGCCYPREDLMKKVTGESLNVKHYADYLTKKYSKLYKL